jgi:hypothetical protein
MTIRKATVTYTFMFDDTINTVDEVNAMDLEDIMAECNTGHMLGLASWGDHNIVEVPNDKVAEEEIALGCDGTFFADPDELEHARLDAEGDEGRPDRDCDPDCSRRAHPAAECDCSRSK